MAPSKNKMDATHPNIMARFLNFVLVLMVTPIKNVFAGLLLQKSIPKVNDNLLSRIKGAPVEVRLMIFNAILDNHFRELHLRFPDMPDKSLHRIMVPVITSEKQKPAVPPRFSSGDRAPTPAFELMLFEIGNRTLYNEFLYERIKRSTLFVGPCDDQEILGGRWRESAFHDVPKFIRENIQNIMVSARCYDDNESIFYMSKLIESFGKQVDGSCGISAKSLRTLTLRFSRGWWIDDANSVPPGTTIFSMKQFYYGLFQLLQCLRSEVPERRSGLQHFTILIIADELEARDSVTIAEAVRLFDSMFGFKVTRIGSTVPSNGLVGSICLDWHTKETTGFTIGLMTLDERLDDSDTYEDEIEAIILEKLEHR